MSNLHGILNNLVNELTESTWNVSPADADIAVARVARGQQEAAEQQARREFPYLANAASAMGVNVQPVSPITQSFMPKTQEELDQKEQEVLKDIKNQRLADEVQRNQDVYDLATSPVGSYLPHGAVETAVDAQREIAAHPWIYGGLGAAALASGAGALALRKRLAKTKNQ